MRPYHVAIIPHNTEQTANQLQSVITRSANVEHLV